MRKVSFIFMLVLLLLALLPPFFLSTLLPLEYSRVMEKADRTTAFVAINSRNLLTFGLTYFVNDWLEEQGCLRVFSTLGAVFLAVCTLTIPLWIFG